MTAPVVAAAAEGAGGSAAAGAAGASSSSAAGAGAARASSGAGTAVKSRSTTSSPAKKTTPAKAGGTAKKGGGKKAADAAGAAGGGKGNGNAGKAAYKRYKRLPGARKAIVAEFVACALILALSPLTSKHRDEPPGAWVKRASGICALFVVLGLVSAGGPRAAKLSAAFGGLVTLTLAVSDRDVFAALATRLNAKPGPGPSGPPANPDEATPDAGARPPAMPGPGARPQRPIVYPNTGRAI